MSKVIVTGATGYIGRNLVENLIKDNHVVGIIVRENSKLDIFNENTSKIKIFKMNDDINQLINFFKEFNAECVFHLASACIVEHKNTDIEKIINSNIKFGSFILEAMKDSNIKNIINTGSFSQHYNNEEYNPASFYAATKEGFEKILEYYVQAENFKAITLKLFDTYGIGDTRSKVLNIIKDKAIKNEEINLSPGEQKMDLIYIEDVVNGFLKALEYLNNINNGMHKKYAICTGRKLTLKEIVQIFEIESKLSIKANFGKLQYRKREIMEPWCNCEILPNWKSKISLEEGIRRILEEENLKR